MSWKINQFIHENPLSYILCSVYVKQVPDIIEYLSVVATRDVLFVGY